MYQLVVAEVYKPESDREKQSEEPGMACSAVLDEEGSHFVEDRPEGS